MRRGATGLAMAAILFTAAAASAQEKRFEFNAGGGYTFLTGEARNHLGDGINLNLGFTFWVNDWLGFEIQYGYIRLGEKKIAIPVSPTPGGVGIPTDFTGQMNGQYGDFDLVLRPKSSGKLAPYFSGGVGLYYRSVAVTTPGVGFVPGGCDAYWFYCYPGGFVAVDQVVASRSSYDMGIDVGGGVKFNVTDKTTMYVEARYHRIWGPTITLDPALVAAGAPSSVTANGQFFPIVVGFRF